ncbi:tRNA-binding protein [Candidatus Geothermarchaeota archaeon ex4572_27]|nr:MAG: tRNA-binding protein [Candidatus Geothermarchaeota archaeon ex4572_27]
MSGDRELVSLDLFNRMDIRVVEVVSVERIPGKTKIYKGVIDIGGERLEIVIGGAEYYPPEYFVGKKFVAIVNLEPKRIAGVLSRGMLLAAVVGDKPIWIVPEEDVPVGTRVY